MKGKLAHLCKGRIGSTIQYSRVFREEGPSDRAISFSGELSNASNRILLTKKSRESGGRALPRPVKLGPHVLQP